MTSAFGPLPGVVRDTRHWGSEELAASAFVVPPAEKMPVFPMRVMLDDIGGIGCEKILTDVSKKNARKNEVMSTTVNNLLIL